jgi:hypothetical protein
VSNINSIRKNAVITFLFLFFLTSIGMCAWSSHIGMKSSIFTNSDNLAISQGTFEEWYTTWKGNGTRSRLNDIFIDNSGNVYVTGTSGNLGGLESYNLTLYKCNSAGDIVWGHEYRNDSNFFGIGNSIKSDASGNIYVAVGASEVIGEKGIVCLLKYSPSGNLILERKWGNGDDHRYGSDLALDSEGNIYISGFTRSWGLGDYNMILVKFNSTGHFQWNVTYGADTASSEIGVGIAINSINDDIYVVGSVNYTDIFLNCYNSTGNLQWSKGWDSGSTDEANALVLNSNNDIFITGESNNDVLLVKYDSFGNQQWNKTWGTMGEDYGRDISIDSSNNIYITGGSMYGEGAQDISILKYTNNGELEWGLHWGSAEIQEGNGIFFVLPDTYYVCGWYDLVYGDSIFEDNLLLKSVIATPSIVINTPVGGTEYTTDAPDYNIGILGTYEEIWYTLDNGVTNYTISSLTGTINQTAWDDLVLGTVTIIFYARNYYGQIGGNLVQVTKTSPTQTQPPISGYSILALIGITVVISGILVRKKLKK